MALQDVLSSLQNPAASRSAILQRLGVDPNRAAGYGGNTQFDQGMANLYTQGLKTASDLDTEEGNLNRGYEQNLAQAAIDRDRALKAIKEGYAARGMTFSGANVDDVAQATGDYTRYVGNLGADRDAGINTVGRNRANLEQGLGSGKTSLESGYGADLGAFLQQQAQALWDSVTQQNQQNALLQAMNNRPAAPRAAAPRAPAPAPVAKPAPYNVLGGNMMGSTVKKPATNYNLVGRMRY